MNNFLKTIEYKGWDKFLLDVKNEFKSIREDLSIVDRDDFLANSLIHSNSHNDKKTLINIQDEFDIKKEFSKLREELNIDFFVI